MPAIEQLEIAADPRAWNAAGFRIEGDSCDVSRVCLRLTGPAAGRGIVGWTLGEAPTRAHPAPPHPNGVVALDHVVMLSSDLDRTAGELEDQGFELRRVRDGPTPGGSTRQAFFRAGEPILEVVQAPPGTSVARDPGAPARLWGLAFLTQDIESSARALGDLLGAPRDAVQPGRRIATVKAEAGLGTAIALMTPGPGAI